MRITYGHLVGVHGWDTYEVSNGTNKKTYTQQQVDVLEAFSYITWKFAIKKRDVSNITKQITNALNRKKEKLAAERLINGFDATYTHYDLLNGAKTITITGGDSLEAFSTAHTREDGGTNMNNVVNLYMRPLAVMSM